MFSKLIFEESMHQRTKSGSCISQTKRHEEKLIVPFMSSKCNFWDVLSLYLNLMVTEFEVDFRKCSARLVNPIILQWLN